MNFSMLPALATAVIAVVCMVYGMYLAIWKTSKLERSVLKGEFKNRQLIWLYRRAFWTMMYAFIAAGATHTLTVVMG